MAVVVFWWYGLSVAYDFIGLVTDYGLAEVMTGGMVGAGVLLWLDRRPGLLLGASVFLIYFGAFGLANGVDTRTLEPSSNRRILSWRPACSRSSLPDMTCFRAGESNSSFRLPSPLDAPARCSSSRCSSRSSLRRPSCWSDPSTVVSARDGRADGPVTAGSVGSLRPR